MTVHINKEFILTYYATTYRSILPFYNNIWLNKKAKPLLVPPCGTNPKSVLSVPGLYVEYECFEYKCVE